VATKYLNDVEGAFKVPLKDDNNKTVAYLLWGDPLHVGASSGDLVKVKARGKDELGNEREGWIPKSAVTDEGLLELYVIDVGQGDGVLMRTPDDAWHLIDAGVSNEKQMTKKGAANFVRWKFMDDLKRDKVSLDTVTVTHPDFDHYGGLLNLLSGTVPGRPTFPVEVGAFYHCGMGRFKDAPKLGGLVQGAVPPLPYPDYGIDESGLGKCKHSEVT
jgi:glyoxylase-like metal-dependent hydrolase (beta-lactamase superfamily II)